MIWARVARSTVVRCNVGMRKCRYQLFRSKRGKKDGNKKQLLKQGFYCEKEGKVQKYSEWFDWNISTSVFIWKWHYFGTEWALKDECIKPVYVLRYSDGAVLISQLSKSCSCGIKTDTVPVGDLGGGREVVVVEGVGVRVRVRWGK